GEPYTTGQGSVPVVPSFPVYAEDPAVSSLVARYVAAAAPQANRVVGKLSGPVDRVKTFDRENSAGDFLADAMLFGGRKAGAQIALTNQGGVRADLIPSANGDITFGQIFAVQPF